MHEIQTPNQNNIPQGVVKLPSLDMFNYRMFKRWQELFNGRADIDDNYLKTIHVMIHFLNDFGEFDGADIGEWVKDLDSVPIGFATWFAREFDEYTSIALSPFLLPSSPKEE